VCLTQIVLDSGMDNQGFMQDVPLVRGC